MVKSIPVVKPRSIASMPRFRTGLRTQTGPTQGGKGLAKMVNYLHLAEGGEAEESSDPLGPRAYADNAEFDMARATSGDIYGIGGLHAARPKEFVEHALEWVPGLNTHYDFADAVGKKPIIDKNGMIVGYTDTDSFMQSLTKKNFGHAALQALSLIPYAGKLSKLGPEFHLLARMAKQKEEADALITAATNGVRAGDNAHEMQEEREHEHKAAGHAAPHHATGGAIRGIGPRLADGGNMLDALAAGPMADMSMMSTAGDQLADQARQRWGEMRLDMAGDQSDQALGRLGSQDARNRHAQRMMDMVLSFGPAGAERAAGRMMGPLAKTWTRENIPAAIVSPKPGVEYGQIWPVTNRDARVGALSERSIPILESQPMRDLMGEHFGIGDYKIAPTVGTWKGSAEPSFVISGGMDAAQARKLANAGGFGMWQDAAASSAPNASLLEGTPTFLIGKGSKLTGAEKEKILSLSKDAGVDLTFTMDGKGAKFSYWGDPEGLAAHEKAITSIANGAKLPERLLVRSKGELDEAHDYLKNLQQARSGGVGEGRLNAGLETGASGSPGLFRGLVRHLLGPYTRAAESEGFGFNPEAFSLKHRLTQSQYEDVINGLRSGSDRGYAQGGPVRGLVHLAGGGGIATLAAQAPQPQQQMPSPWMSTGGLQMPQGQMPQRMPPPPMMNGGMQMPPGRMPMPGMPRMAGGGDLGSLAGMGQGGDNTLAHISTGEQQLLSQLHGGTEINPQTGLPQYGWLGNVLKGLVRAGAAIAGGMIAGPAGAAIGSGLSTKLTGGSWSDALKGAAMSGIGGEFAQGIGGGGWSPIGTNNAVAGYAPTLENAAPNSIPLSEIGHTPVSSPTFLQAAKSWPGMAEGLGALSTPLDSSGGSGSKLAAPAQSGPAPFSVRPTERTARPYTGDLNKYGFSGAHQWYEDTNPAPIFGPPVQGGVQYGMNYADGGEVDPRDVKHAFDVLDTRRALDTRDYVRDLGEYQVTGGRYYKRPADREYSYERRADGGEVDDSLMMDSDARHSMDVLDARSLMQARAAGQLGSERLMPNARYFARHADPSYRYAVPKTFGARTLKSFRAMANDPFHVDRVPGYAEGGDPGLGKLVNASLAGWMAAASGGMAQRSHEGMVRGPGTGTSDSIPAMLSNGEHVVTAKETSRLGGGDNDLGQKRLYQLRRAIKQHGPAVMKGIGNLKLSPRVA